MLVCQPIGLVDYIIIINSTEERLGSNSFILWYIRTINKIMFEACVGLILWWISIFLLHPYIFAANKWNRFQDTCGLQKKLVWLRWGGGACGVYVSPWPGFVSSPWTPLCCQKSQLLSLFILRGITVSPSLYFRPS